MARDAHEILRAAVADLARDLYRETMKKPVKVTIELHPLVFREVVRAARFGSLSAGVMVVHDINERRRPTYTFGVDGVTDSVTIVESHEESGWGLPHLNPKPDPEVG